MEKRHAVNRFRKAFCHHKWEYNSEGSIRSCPKCGVRQRKVFLEENYPVGPFIYRLSRINWQRM